MFNVPLNQVLNVSFKYIENWNTNTSTSSFGHSRQDFDLNFMCKYCYNEDTEIVRDVAYLAPYEPTFINTCSYWKCIHCWMCNAIFFTYKLKES